MRILFSLIFAATVASRATAEDVHMYFLGGQSNGNGRANAADIPVGSPLASPQPDVKLWYHVEQSATNIVLPRDQIINLAPGAGYGSSGPVYPVEFGPELTFGRTLADALPDQNIMIVKYTYGGSALGNPWQQGGRDYTNFIETANAAIAAVKANGDNPIPMGMIWVQGEADVSQPTFATNYGTNLADLTSRVRRDLFDGNNARFVYSQLSDNQYPVNPLPDGVIAVRNGQAWVDSNVTNAAMVVTDDDALFTTISIGSVHYDANGQINLGIALGNAVIASGAQAPSLVQGQLTSIGETQGLTTNTLVAGVSVTPGHEGYSLGNGSPGGDDGLNTGGLDQSFNNPIIDYAFYSTPAGNSSITEFAGGGSSIIGTATSAGTNSSSLTNSTLRIWTTSEPAVDLLNGNFMQIARPSDVTGTINISSLSSGSVYLFFGLNNSADETTTITFSMTGSGQTPVTPAPLVLAGASEINETLAVRYDFADAEDYETITYTYALTSTTATNANRARFGGIVVTGFIPPEITSFSVDTGTDTATIDFKGAPNTSYICKSSTHLVSFPDEVTASNGSFTTDGTGFGTADVDITTAGAKRFYRLETP